MNLPRTSICSDPYNNSYVFNVYNPNLYYLLPLIKEILDLHIGDILYSDKNILYEYQQKINYFLYNLIELGYLIEINNNYWELNIIDFIKNEIEDTRIIYYSNKTLSECLIDQNGGLHPKLKQDSKLIEWFKEKLNTAIFNEAVEKYKNEIILNIANVK